MTRPIETMGATHTPGPWHTDPDCGNESVLCARGSLVADCAIFGPGTSNARNLANAQLIAAAPDLLAFAKLVDADIPAADLGNLTRYIEKLQTAARAAIAKAEGV